MNAPTPALALLAQHQKTFETVPALMLPLTLFRPSPTNPRKRFRDDKLAEMACSINRLGVLQAILARPTPGWNGEDGTPPYEIVSGECRWRSSALPAAGTDTIPARIRELSDFEVLEIQLLENVDREDLHPLEEAQGMRQLLDSPEGQKLIGNADGLADRMGKSRRWVYKRLALLNLCQPAREAFLEDRINASVAGLIARMPNEEQQAEALAKILEGFGGEPMSFRSASEWLQKNYMLRLAHATFDIQAVYEVAGPCGQCGKRSGAHPDLFNDVPGSDYCQDSACFEAKGVEAYERELDAARKKGQKVLQGADARSLMPSTKVLPTGYHWLDKPCPALTDSKRPLVELMGENKQVLVLAHPGADLPIYLAPESAVRKALKAKGVLREEAKAAPAAAPTPAAAPSTEPAWPEPQRASAAPAPVQPAPAVPQLLSEADIEARVHTVTGQRFCQLLAAQLRTEIAANELPLVPLRILVTERMADCTVEAWKLMYAMQGWELPGDGTGFGVTTDLQARLAELDGRAIAELLIVTLLVDELSDGDTLEDLESLGDSRALALGRHYGVPIEDLADQAQQYAIAEAEAEQQRRRVEAGCDAADAFAKVHGAAA